MTDAGALVGRRARLCKASSGRLDARSFCGFCVTRRCNARRDGSVARESDPARLARNARADPVQAELAMKRGELTMQVELLEAKTETCGPLGRRRSRR